MEAILNALKSRGVLLKRSWLQSCGVVPLNANAVWARMLECDVRDASEAALSMDLFEPEMHGKVVEGPVLLQCEDWRDIAQPTQQGDGLVEVEDVMEDDGNAFGRRNMSAQTKDVATQSAKRMLKLLCTDGAQDVLAFEYRLCRQLDPSAMKKGCKIVVKKCRVLRGHLALTPECVEFVGGQSPRQQEQPQQQQQHQMAGQSSGAIEDLDDATMMALLQAEQRHTNQQQERRRNVDVEPEAKPTQGEKRPKKKKYLSSDSSG